MWAATATAGTCLPAFLPQAAPYAAFILTPYLIATLTAPHTPRLTGLSAPTFFILPRRASSRLPRGRTESGPRDHAAIVFSLSNVDPSVKLHPFLPPPLRMSLMKRKLHELSGRAARSYSSSDCLILSQGRLARSTPGVASPWLVLRRRYHACCCELWICQTAELHYCTHTDQCALVLLSL